ncbi:uncharacterized protein AAES06_005991 [Glossophaga mutica]
MIRSIASWATGFLYFHQLCDYLERKPLVRKRHPCLRAPCLCRHCLQGLSPAGAAAHLGLLRGVWLPSQAQTSEAAPHRHPPALSCEAAPPCAALLSAAAHLSQALHTACEVRLHLQLHQREAPQPDLAVHPRRHVVLSGTRHQNRVPVFAAVDAHEVVLPAAVHPRQVLLAASAATVHPRQFLILSAVHLLQVPLAAAALPGPEVVQDALLLYQSLLPIAAHLDQALPSRARHPGQALPSAAVPAQ